MTLSQEFALLLSAADALKADLANAGIPRHCHEAVNALADRLESFALKVAASEAAKPAPPK